MKAKVDARLKKGVREKLKGSGNAGEGVEMSKERAGIVSIPLGRAGWRVSPLGSIL